MDDWYKNGWLKRHKTSAEEIRGLMAIVGRDLQDGCVDDISLDWRFGIAYNAALKLCTLVLYSEGYRAARDLQHYRTIQAMMIILGSDRKDDVAYLDACRKKRNIVEYEQAGVTTEAQADELVEFVRNFRTDVVAWLTENHPELVDR
ncbi:MAG: hypothetical protein EHM23_16605 [Acidobacteria bacterium]|nr:MAG: hypothetical protein EHM23_16605 [Acidobacteriota bacterium]